MKILTIIFVLLLSIMVAWFYESGIQVPNQLAYVPPVSSSIIDAPQDDAKEAIVTINSQYAALKTMSADLSVTASAKITTSLHGNMSFEKDKRFRMRLSSRFGLETDIGSNDQYFWFWSKRMKPAYLYYASHQNVQKVPLKPLFHPLWMMECLGVGDIDMAGAITYNQDERWIVRQSRVGTMGQLMVKITIVDARRRIVLGHYLYDDDQKLVASSEVLEFQTCSGFVVPKKIRMLWREENAGMELELINIKINSALHQSLWIMPNITRKNLAEM